MIGEITLVGKKAYLQVNVRGTLQQLPPLRWWWIFYFIIKSKFKPVHIAEIRRKSYEGNAKDTAKFFEKRWK